MLVAIDPSIRACGVALFTNESELIGATTIMDVDDTKPLSWRIQEIALRVKKYVIDSTMVPNIELLITEWPQSYAGKTRDSNDLFGLCAIPFAVAGHTIPVRAYTPREWSGQIPKSTRKSTANTSPRAKRIKSRLTRKELKHWPEGQHDAIDSVGIGLHYFGRLNPVRIFPGATDD